MAPHSNQWSRDPNEREDYRWRQGSGASPLMAQIDRSLTNSDHLLTSDFARQMEGVA
jgi:hypothetical protein